MVGILNKEQCDFATFFGQSVYNPDPCTVHVPDEGIERLGHGLGFAPAGLENGPILLPVENQSGQMSRYKRRAQAPLRG